MLLLLMMMVTANIYGVASASLALFQELAMH